MNEPPDNIKLSLLFTLHRGFVETRLLAQGGHARQIFELADALELIPGMLKNWQHGDLDRVRALLEIYQAKYPLGFDFLSRLNNKLPLEF